MKVQRDERLKKLGAALHEYPVAARLLETTVAPRTAALTFTLRKDKLRQARKREGRYLLRSNITAGRTPAELWQFYIQLTEVEAAFKNLKDDLALRPIHHQLEHRIEAHIFISFLAYCLQVTLRRRLRDLAPGLTPRSVLEKFATIQMLDVHLPTTDERTVILSRYTQPETDVQILLQRLKLELPAQPPPRITAPKPPGESSSVVKT
jgi:transposase